MEGGVPSRAALLAVAGPELAPIVGLCLNAATETIGRLQVRPWASGGRPVGFLLRPRPLARL